MGLCGASAARPRRTARGVATLVELSAATTAGTARGPRWRHGALLHVRAAPARGHRESQAGAAAEGAIAAGGTAPGARPALCTITTRNRAGGSVGSPSLPRATETSGDEALTMHRLDQRGRRRSPQGAHKACPLRRDTRQAVRGNSPLISDAKCGGPRPRGVRSTPGGPDPGWRRRRRQCRFGVGVGQDTEQPGLQAAPRRGRLECAESPHVRPLDQSLRCGAVIGQVDRRGVQPVEKRHGVAIEPGDDVGRVRRVGAVKGAGTAGSRGRPGAGGDLAGMCRTAADHLSEDPPRLRWPGSGTSRAPSAPKAGTPRTTRGRASAAG